MVLPEAIFYEGPYATFYSYWFANNVMIIMALCNIVTKLIVIILHLSSKKCSDVVMQKMCFKTFILLYIRYLWGGIVWYITAVWLIMIYISPTLGFCLIFMSKLGTQGSTSVGNFPRILRLIIISSLCSLCRLINFHSLKDVDIKRRNYCHRTSTKYNKNHRTPNIRIFWHLQG